MRKFILAASMLLPYTGCASAPPKSYRASTPIVRAEPVSTASTGSSERELLKERIYAGSLPSNYKTLIRRVISQSLFDPDSGRFQWDSTPHGGLVCGKINAKNRLGGYTGFRTFLAGFDNSKHLIGISMQGEGYVSEKQFALSYMQLDCIQADPTLE